MLLVTSIPAVYVHLLFPIATHISYPPQHPNNCITLTTIPLLHSHHCIHTTSSLHRNQLRHNTPTIIPQSLHIHHGTSRYHPNRCYPIVTPKHNTQPLHTHQFTPSVYPPVTPTLLHCYHCIPIINTVPSAHSHLHHQNFGP